MVVTVLVVVQQLSLVSMPGHSRYLVVERP
jgi:hypothetical protein